MIALLAPGPSLTHEVVAKVRHLMVGAVTSAFPLAPWADFLAANDASFWRLFKGARDFAGRKFSANHIAGVERVQSPVVGSSTSSGVLALEVARTRYQGETILLLGFDNHGTHFFGPYSGGLSNTPPSRREAHAKQFEQWSRAHKGVTVWNCTPDSALTCFPRKELDECL